MKYRNKETLAIRFSFDDPSKIVFYSFGFFLLFMV
jgi:hypothetical protein